MIDDYLLAGCIHGAMSYRPGGPPTAERVLTLKGFEAVPAMMKQLGSKRMTNHILSSRFC